MIAQTPSPKIPTQIRSQGNILKPQQDLSRLPKLLTPDLSCNAARLVQNLATPNRSMSSTDDYRSLIGILKGVDEAAASVVRAPLRNSLQARHERLDRKEEEVWRQRSVSFELDHVS